jgi:hypothetical protein
MNKIKETVYIHGTWEDSNLTVTSHVGHIYFSIEAALSSSQWTCNTFLFCQMHTYFVKQGLKVEIIMGT